MFAFRTPANDGGRVRRIVQRLGLGDRLNHISHDLEVIHIADSLLEIREHAMVLAAYAAPIPSKGLVHQFIAKACDYSG